MWSGGMGRVFAPRPDNDVFRRSFFVLSHRRVVLLVVVVTFCGTCGPYCLPHGRLILQPRRVKDTRILSVCVVDAPLFVATKGSSPTRGRSAAIYCFFSRVFVLGAGSFVHAQLVSVGRLGPFSDQIAEHVAISGADTSVAGTLLDRAKMLARRSRKRKCSKVTFRRHPTATRISVAKGYEPHPLQKVMSHFGLSSSSSSSSSSMGGSDGGVSYMWCRITL